MKERPLACTRCGGPVEIVEDTYGSIAWGPAVVDGDGVVRPRYPDPKDGYQTVTHDGGIRQVRACCMGETCGHEWRLRRRFDPSGLDS